MCQRTEKLNDLSMDPNIDGGGRNIVIQTNVVTIQSATPTPPPPSSPSPPPPPSSLADQMTSATTTTTTTTTLPLQATAIEVNAIETNGKHSPAAALSPSSITLSPCSDIDQRPNNGATTPTPDDLEEYEEVKKFFDKRLHIIERWLRDRATPDIQSKLHDATDIIPKSPKLRTSSVTSDLFQQWLSSSPVQVCQIFILVIIFSTLFYVPLRLCSHCTATSLLDGTVYINK